MSQNETLLKGGMGLVNSLPYPSVYKNLLNQPLLNIHLIILNVKKNDRLINTFIKNSSLSLLFCLLISPNKVGLLI